MVRPASAIVARERGAIAAHRAAIAGAALPAPRSGPRGTFLHGFFLPFSLIVATLRDRDLRRPYLRVTAVRLVAVAAAALLFFSGDKAKRDGAARRGPAVVIHHDAKEPPAAVSVDVPGVHVDIDETRGTEHVSVLGTKIAVEHVGERPTSPKPEAAAAPAPPPPPPPRGLARAWSAVRHGWAWILALVAFLSAAEGVIVFLSRRWDDWISFHASRLAGIVPEDDAPKTPKIAVDVRWLVRKLKRRVRGYVVFAAGVPAFAVLRLIPAAGPWLFSAALTAWTWYWIGVFAASKSAHAWADEAAAPAPAPIRFVRARTEGRWWAAPVALYARAWAWLTRGVNPPAATFERSPAAFLGLAIARVILAFPGLYLLARPIVPVAAGRLCAESDPLDRFALRAVASPAEPVAPAAAA